ncbi:LacI family transcriptional regulator [Sporosarcina sp. ACRSM]|uniref:LacI family DNA-binding transcriptional regulator n=1 Tax=Sporosarcina sp. ACRSM TaxID=2918216 RepID=UPI001EF49B62|nr:LacI family DNA-binding transcriptional regulator [Sporosarcina sp. ACRSM]MCG7335754.1 LacI family transcriptional regulator [Sporosarcina sp. ACRSM]
MATIRDVAKLANVSIATVSRVINQNGYVNGETKKKVNNAIELLKYKPNSIAKGLASGKTKTMALILPDISNPFFSELARAVEDSASSQGYTVFLCNTDSDTNKEKDYIRKMKDRFVDGILFAGHTLQEPEIKTLEEEKIPLVVLDRAPGEDICLVVRSNNREGAKLAVRHLLEIGCNKIAHIYGPQEVATARERLLGFEEAVKEFSWYTPSLLEQGDFTIKGGMDAVGLLLKRHPDVDGIFTGNDLMALGALKKLKQLKIKVPDQISLIGFDGIELTEITEPEITTIAQPIYQIGSLATSLLIKKIEGSLLLHKSHEIDVELVVRGSTKGNSKVIS